MGRVLTCRLKGLILSRLAAEQKVESDPDPGQNETAACGDKLRIKNYELRIMNCGGGTRWKNLFIAESWIHVVKALGEGVEVAGGDAGERINQELRIKS